MRYYASTAASGEKFNQVDSTSARLSELEVDVRLLGRDSASSTWVAWMRRFGAYWLAAW